MSFLSTPSSVFAISKRSVWIYRLVALALVTLLLGVGVSPYKWLLLTMTVSAAIYFEYRCQTQYAKVLDLAKGEPTIAYFVHAGRVTEVAAGRWSRDAGDLVLTSLEGQRRFSETGLFRLDVEALHHGVWLDLGNGLVWIQPNPSLSRLQTKEIVGMFDPIVVKEPIEEGERSVQAVMHTAGLPHAKMTLFFMAVLGAHYASRSRYEMVFAMLFLICGHAIILRANSGKWAASPERGL